MTILGIERKLTGKRRQQSRAYQLSISDLLQDWMLRAKFIDRPLLALTSLGGSIGWRAKNRLTMRIVLRSPDRAVLQGEIFPAFRNAGHLNEGSSVLWIGCAPYTVRIPKMLERDGAKCFTIDINPAEEYSGRRGRHTVGDLLELDRHYTAGAFDLIFCNGVLGWGVNAVEDQLRAYEVMAGALRRGGALVVGWNSDRMEDPVALKLHVPHFEHRSIAGIPQRRAVAGTTHIYDFFLRP